MKQEYVIKKYIKANTAIEAIEKDSTTPVSECFLVSDKPIEGNCNAVGFQIVRPEDPAE